MFTYVAATLPIASRIDGNTACDNSSKYGHQMKRERERGRCAIFTYLLLSTKIKVQDMAND